MPRVALDLGENSIDRARIAKEENGSLSMQWFVRLPNGRSCAAPRGESAARASCAAGRTPKQMSLSP